MNTIRSTFAAAVLLATTTVAGADAPPNPTGLVLQCSVVEYYSNQKKVAYAPGDDLVFRIYGNVPASRVAQNLRIEASLSARVHGFPFGGKLGDTVVEIPASGMREMVRGIGREFEDGIADGFEFRGENDLILGWNTRVPDRFPDSSADLKVDVTFAPGTPDAQKVTCKRRIKVDNAAPRTEPNGGGQF